MILKHMENHLLVLCLERNMFSVILNTQTLPCSEIYLKYAVL